ncbi:ATP-binding cassette domain-containing protein [Flavobacterium circumlabens]|uniref:ATP-binding cassette domain-containing protein n=1 Tax=Flavobacterium circumlabens TaxID=2133765 RepID=A0A4Y7UAI9_9FLAO|nr:ABC transporter ATP-binding protein [Flavobacterium circumlabens]TCN56386.1 lipopolysaccharide transport system ATP-binding protein [Flavobacterium circumlabens]TEB43420.1 ATP-binding cassette domain-containing protein [Flavobacterium circumlabens]
MKKDIILKAENISKQYRLGEVGTGTLIHDLNRWWHQIRGKENPYLRIGDTNDRSKKGTSDYVWALQDINFEVERGQVLGIIGKNGAGKSTLLKILSKVTAPTTGSIKSRGRIASLLEVGTGFHGEMTGRENIFLNGAILGMTKKEIASKLDEIIGFSGCERYIDTPVKRYSSGMTVRLAFAVAAFLEPEILVIDEVLAVGDAEFQKKAIGKMQDISKGEGRTVLFVSHNMAAVKSLCTRGIILEHGKVVFEGEIENAVSYYLGGDAEAMNLKTFGKEYDLPIFKLNEISLNNSGRTSDDVLRENELIILHTKIDIKVKDAQRYHITYHLFNEMGEVMFSFSNAGSFSLKNGLNDITCDFPESFFQSGQYFLSLFIVEDAKKPIFIESDIISFTVVDSGRELGTYMGREPGYIKPQFDWKIK